LALYVPAVVLPVMAISRFGHVNRAGILGGIADMLAHGQWLIGLLVLLCSVVIPLLKIGGLLAISLGHRRMACRSRARTHRLIEWTGRWSMVDVLLVAVLVATLKLGDLVSVEIGPGLYAFAGCVVLSLAASASFDPRLAWSDA
jgi:paraquat-inducible protein A